jgi:hypothetical protein
MKRIRLSITIIALMALVGIRAHADPINIYVGGGSVTFTHNSGGGQNLSFSGLRLSTLDSSFNTPLTISSGAGGFLFNSAAGGQGYFAPLNAAFFTMGSTSSGIARGTIDSIQIIGATVGSSLTSFTLQLSFGNLSFQQCSTSNCTNSSTLMQFATAPAGSAVLHFSFQNTTATTVAQLLALGGTHSSTMSGEFDADSTSVTPEPASLALFGSGLLLLGLRIGRKKSKV